jgi:lipopolysaccharide export system permease protein
VKITLQKYILAEMIPIFVSSLVVFGFLMLGTRMLSVTELIVSQGVSVGQVLHLVLFLLPGIVFFALPAASLIASLLAFVRLSSDNEVIALKSSGISLYQVLPPVLVFSAIAFLLAVFTAFAGLPWGNRSMRGMVLEIAESRADVGLKERVFSQPFDDVVFYVTDLSSGNRVMKDVFVVDKREREMTYTIIAREGRILLQPEARAIVVRFVNGTIFMQQREPGSIRTVQFKSYDLKVGLEDIMESLAAGGKAPKEMSSGELLERLKKLPWNSRKRNEILVELLERITLPVAVLFLGVIGVPLGTHMRSRSFSFGIGVGLVLFLIYYMIFMGVRSVCETGEMSPWIGMWLPNGFLLVSCVYLFRHVANEKPLPLSPEGPFRRWLADRFPSRRDRRSSRERGAPEETGRAPHPERREREAPLDARASESGTAEIPGSAYVGNIRLERFHRPECPCLRRLSPHNRREFGSREEAVYADYDPCRVCKP